MSLMIVIETEAAMPGLSVVRPRPGRGLSVTLGVLRQAEAAGAVSRVIRTIDWDAVAAAAPEPPRRHARL